MQIKKLTPLEQSKMRDELAMMLVADTIGNGGHLTIAKAFHIAEEFVEGRRIGKEEVEMDCGCKETPPVKVKRFIPKAPVEEKVTYKVPAYKKPPLWFRIVLGVVVTIGCFATISKIVEFVKWIF